MREKSLLTGGNTHTGIRTGDQSREPAARRPREVTRHTLLPTITVTASLGLALAACRAADRSAQNGPVTTAPVAATQNGLLDVGSPAPPLQADVWVNGKAVAIQERAHPPVLIVLFWATWSAPSRAALADVSRLYEQWRARGVSLVGVTDERADTVRAFVKDFEPKLRFPIALDDSGRATASWCEAASVRFVPYIFVLGPERTVAWHGHPQQPELATIVEQLLTGSYDPAAAGELVRRARSVDQLEALFRDAYAKESWRTALLALDSLLATDVPKQRLQRYKLAILLGDLDEREQAGTLVDELLRQYADNPRFLNTLAWDVVSQPRLYTHDPGIGLKLARAAYSASRGEDPAIADTYARALYILGRLDLAIAMQRRAVDRSGPEQKEAHQRTLTFYEACQKLQAQIGPETP